jgi:hypothetical protein
MIKTKTTRELALEEIEKSLHGNKLSVTISLLNAKRELEKRIVEIEKGLIDLEKDIETIETITDPNSELLCQLRNKRFYNYLPSRD